MGAYRSDRRTDAIPALNAVSTTEAAQGTDLRRQTQIERFQEAAADDLRKQQEKGQKRSFAALVKKK